MAAGQYSLQPHTKKSTDENDKYADFFKPTSKPKKGQSRPNKKSARPSPFQTPDVTRRQLEQLGVVLPTPSPHPDTRARAHANTVTGPRHDDHYEDHEDHEDHKDHEDDQDPDDALWEELDQLIADDEVLQHMRNCIDGMDENWTNEFSPEEYEKALDDYIKEESFVRQQYVRRSLYQQNKVTKTY